MAPQIPSPPMPLALLQAIKSLTDSFETALARGIAPAPETLLAKVPAEGRAELFRQLLRLEADHRRMKGKPLTGAEARERFASLGSWALGVLSSLGLDDTEPLLLTGTAGPGAGRTFQVAAGSNCLVGRGPAGVQLAVEADLGMSRVHFMVEYNPPAARLADMRSKNKTRVNGVVIEQIDLNDGDEVKAGQTTFRVGMPSFTEHTMTISGQVPPEATQNPPSNEPSPPTMVPATPSSNQGSTLASYPGYEIVSEIARGGMGVVCQALRMVDGRIVALKTVHPAVAPRADTMARFTREVAILQRLSHPNIVTYLDAGETFGTVYFVMEFVEGESASTLVKRHGPFAANRVVALGCQLLDALAHAHAHGVVHRDVKPSNILLTTIAGHEVLKLADFGLARAYQASAMSGLTMTGTPGGTPGFMPPEQVLDFRSARPAADQYAAAATLYYLLTGHPIYEPSPTTMDMMVRILNEEPIPLRPQCPPMPPKLAEVIRRALIRDVSKRFPDVMVMREALANSLRA